MNITVIGGTGETGREVVAEAARRGHTVTSVSRSGKTPEGAASAVAAELSDTARIVELINDADVTVISVSPDRTGGPTQPTADAHQALIEARPTGRMVIVGGAGSLLDEKGQRLVDSPEFPAEYKPEALTFSDVLESYRAAGDAIAWTFASPAPFYPAPTVTGGYVLGTDNPAGEALSAADFALALLDEVEKDAHRSQRFSVAGA